MHIIHEFPISIGILKNWIDLLLLSSVTILFDANFLTMYIFMNLESSPTKATRAEAAP